jgi:hypothetical protein
MLSACDVHVKEGNLLLVFSQELVHQLDFCTITPFSVVANVLPQRLEVVHDCVLPYGIVHLAQALV